jgi:hypothetical protein
MSHTDQFLFDKRLVEKNIRRGLVTRKQYNAHLKTLSDVGDNLEHLELEEDSEEAEEAEAVETAEAAEPAVEA